MRRLAPLFLLLSTFCRVAHASSEQWAEVSSSHFAVLTDSNEKQARHILDQFERMRWVFKTLFPKTNVDPAAPIVVFAAKNRKSFQALEPEVYLAKGQLNLAGLFIRTQDKNYVLLRLDADQEHPFASVYHEYTHLQFSSTAEWMPIWLNEGIAEFFQNTEIRDKDVQLGEPSRNDILFLRQNRLIPLPVLFKIDASSPYYHEEEKGSIFYAESWALTHYLQISDREKGTHRLSDYMTLLSHHEDSLSAAVQAFGNLKQLQSELENYIRAGAYKQFVLSSTAAPIDETTYKVSMLTKAQADAARADVLAGVGRTQDARALLESVLKTEPNNVEAHETMGFVEFREGNRDAARKCYEEAVKLDSQSYLAHYYFAVMSRSTGDRAQEASIEASLQAAIRLNPRFAPAYDQLASFYGMRHEKLEEAKGLSLRAIALDPGQFSFRINAANVFMTMERYSDAQTVLRSAEKLAKNPAEVEMVRSRIAQLDLIQASQAQHKADMAVQPNMQTTQAIAIVGNAPKHPAEPADGPKHSADGVIRGVTCSYPSQIDFRVEKSGKTVTLYSNNYFKIDLTELGSTPSDHMNPCTDFEGMKARVQYAASSDKTVDGQVTAVELHK